MSYDYSIVLVHLCRYAWSMLNDPFFTKGAFRKDDRTKSRKIDPFFPVHKMSAMAPGPAFSDF